MASVSRAQQEVNRSLNLTEPVSEKLSSWPSASVAVHAAHARAGMHCMQSMHCFLKQCGMLLWTKE